MFALLALVEAHNANRRAAKAEAAAVAAGACCRGNRAVLETAEDRLVDVEVIAAAVGDGRPVRCAWEMVPADEQRRIADVVTMNCSRVEPCNVTWASSLAMDP